MTLKSTMKAPVSEPDVHKMCTYRTGRVRLPGENP